MRRIVSDVIALLEKNAVIQTEGEPDGRPYLEADTMNNADIGTRRIVIDRGHEVLYVSLTSEGLIIDALPVGDNADMKEIGAWTFEEMGSDDRPLEVTP